MEEADKLIGSAEQEQVTPAEEVEKLFGSAEQEHFTLTTSGGSGKINW